MRDDPWVLGEEKRQRASETEHQYGGETVDGRRKLDPSAGQPQHRDVGDAIEDAGEHRQRVRPREIGNAAAPIRIDDTQIRQPGSDEVKRVTERIEQLLTQPEETMK
jgi:hypothetical protein